MSSPSPVEERLRRALAQQADATTTAADAWARIHERVGGDGHRPALWFLRWPVLAPVATVTALVLIVMAIAVGRDDDSVHVTGGSGRLYLLATGVDQRFRLVDVTTDPAPAAEITPGTLRAFGRRAADGLALEASVVITVPDNATRGIPDLIPEPTPLRVSGLEISVFTDSVGQRVLSWVQPGGESVGVITDGVSQAELVRLAESLVKSDPTRAEPALPDGFKPLHSGSFPGTYLFTAQGWEGRDGASFGVTVTEVPGVTVDDLAWQLPGGKAKKVRGTTGIYRERGRSELMWIERPGTVVSVIGEGVSEEDLTAIAEGLKRVDESEWRARTAGVAAPPIEGPTMILPSGSPKVLSPANSFFVIRSVAQVLAPPCTVGDPAAPGPTMLAQVQGSREVACYNLGPAAVAADDVLSATARAGASGWDVEFTLTTQGVARFDELAQTLGSGRQIAIVVDGRVVAAPRLAAGSLGNKGVVAGLDEQTARSLASRLRP